MQRVEIGFGDQRVTVADFSRLPVSSPFIAFVPQWDFLTFLADRGTEQTDLTLLRDTEVTALRWHGDRVAGVVARHGDEELALDADLVIGADGRHSVTRRDADLPPPGVAGASRCPLVAPASPRG